MDKKLQISKRPKLKGEDGYKTFSIRVKDDIVKQLDKIVEESHRSRNDIINIMLEFGIENCEVTEE